MFCSRGSIIVSYVIVVTEAVKQTVGEEVVNGLYSLLVFYHWQKTIYGDTWLRITGFFRVDKFLATCTFERKITLDLLFSTQEWSPQFEANGQWILIPARYFNYSILIWIFSSAGKCFWWIFDYLQRHNCAEFRQFRRYIEYYLLDEVWLVKFCCNELRKSYPYP